MASDLTWTDEAGGDVDAESAGLDNSRPIEDIAYDVLCEAIRIATRGRADQPRSGQEDLFDDICETLFSQPAGKQLVGKAPTGSGKSFAALAPAMTAAAINNERTVFSTESLSLQDQILHKDAPVVAEACENITGYRPVFALQKGWSNYVCRSKVDREIAAGRRNRATSDASLRTPNGRALTLWINQQVAAAGTGEKSEYREDLTAADWNAVSIRSSDCVGTKCSFASDCFPRRAREHTAEADLVITNHATLGIQASLGIPVVMGRKNEDRRFDHIIIDECHGLPGAVRNAGSDTMSIKRLDRAADRLVKLLGPRHGMPANVSAAWAKLNSDILDDLEDNQGTAPFILLNPGDAEELSKTVLVWLRPAAEDAAQLQRYPSTDQIADGKQAASTITALRDAVRAIAKGSGDRQAVWAQHDSPQEAIIKFSPVDVSAQIANRLWRYPAPAKPVESAQDDTEAEPDPEEANGDAGGADDLHLKSAADDDTTAPVEPDGQTTDGDVITLSVTCISATVSRSYRREAGIRNEQNFFYYDSPFAREYAESALYIPLVTKGSPDYAQLTSHDGKFDARAHSNWVCRRIGPIVSANGGKALVLAARATDGQNYSEVLRAYGLTVFNQWESPSPRRAVEAWKASPGSILVGTKSLMTGTDAPGVDICTMVYLDRVPRSPTNALDEARVLNALGMDLDDKPNPNQMWAARSRVYAEDAAALLEQAAGRLVRSAGDTGTVIIDDPRLATARANPFRSADRERYLSGLTQFSTTLNDLDDLYVWLASHHHAIESRVREHNPTD